METFDVAFTVMSSSLWPRGLYSPLGSPVRGKNTGVGSHSLLSGIFPTQGSNPGLQHCRQILYCLSHQGNQEWKRWCFFIFPLLVHPLLSPLHPGTTQTSWISPLCPLDLVSVNLWGPYWCPAYPPFPSASDRVSQDIPSSRSSGWTLTSQDLGMHQGDNLVEGKEYGLWVRILAPSLRDTASFPWFLASSNVKWEKWLYFAGLLQRFVNACQASGAWCTTGINTCSLPFSIPVSLMGGDEERWRLPEDKAQRICRAEETAWQLDWEQRRLGGGRDQRLNYADYSFVPCSLHLPWCLLGRNEKQAHTICTQIHKSTHVQTCTQTQMQVEYILLHHTKQAHGRGHPCLLTSACVYILQTHTHPCAHPVIRELMCPWKWVNGQPCGSMQAHVRA